MASPALVTLPPPSVEEELEAALALAASGQS